MKEKTMIAKLVETFVLNTMSSEATSKVGNAMSSGVMDKVTDVTE